MPGRASRTTDGKALERTFWHAIMQVLNLGTHHRGEISAILDMNDVKNDSNSFVSYICPSKSPPTDPARAWRGGVFRHGMNFRRVLALRKGAAG